MHNDDIEKRLDALDKALREIWRAVDLLFSFHGRAGQRCPFDYTEDKAERIKRRILS